MREAAEFLGSTRTRVWQLIRARELDAFHVGRRCVVPVAALVMYLAACRDAERNHGRNGL